MRGCLKNCWHPCTSHKQSATSQSGALAAFGPHNTSRIAHSNTRKVKGRHPTVTALGSLAGQECLLGFLGPQAAFQLGCDVWKFLRQVSEPHQAKVMQRREDHDLAA